MSTTPAPALNFVMYLFGSILEYDETLAQITATGKVPPGLKSAGAEATLNAAQAKLFDLCTRQGSFGIVADLSAERVVAFSLNYDGADPKTLTNPYPAS